MRTRTLLLASALLLLVPFPSGAQQPSAPGALYKSDAEGWQIKPPKAWKHVLNQGRVVFGSDTEAGLMLAWFQPGVTYAQVQELAKEPYQEEGLVLTPGAAAPFSTKAGKALAVNYSGQGMDGTQIRGRAIAVVGGKGTVYAVGITTDAQFAGLTKRVDELARGVSFFAPKAGAGVALLSGTICSSSGYSSGGSGGGYTSTNRMTFNGKGQVSWGSEMVFGGSLTDGNGDTTATYGGWSGNQNQSTDVGTYTVVGDDVTVKWGDGTILACKAHHRVNGRITELMCGKKLYGSPLCN